jgi:hypothetical protein
MLECEACLDYRDPPDAMYSFWFDGGVACEEF